MLDKEEIPEGVNLKKEPKSQGSFTNENPEKEEDVVVGVKDNHTDPNESSA